MPRVKIVWTSSWEIGEGSGTHKEEAKENLGSDNGKAHSSGAVLYHVGVSKVDPPGAESGTLMMVWVVDLTDTVSEVVSPGEGTPLAFSLSEEVFQQHHLLGYNHFSPLSKMGLDINESVTPKLIWDVSLASGKGGEDYNLMDVTPLALWDPNGATKDCETDGSFLEDELEPSEIGRAHV